CFFIRPSFNGPDSNPFWRKFAVAGHMEEALRDLSGEFGMTRNDMIRFIVREWMEKNTYLPVHDLDEDGDVDGEA
ncbi:hypothetical protein AB9E31_35420, partial [Rhizobium leguminosarum]